MQQKYHNLRFFKQKTISIDIPYVFDFINRYYVNNTFKNNKFICNSHNRTFSVLESFYATRKHSETLYYSIESVNLNEFMGRK